MSFKGISRSSKWGTSNYYWLGFNSKIRLGNHSKWEIVLLNQEADELLISQCKNQFLPALRKIPHWNEMSDGKRGALLSFAYNLGAGFYGGDNFNTITKRLKNKEWDLVPDALFLYRNPGSNVEAGLARRRKAEGESWKKG
jgi:lysozyme